jgi:hypothetical protein
MNRPPPRYSGAAPEATPDDLSIPVLTERLGLLPLEFDTTLPVMENTGQMVEPMLEGLTALPDPPVPYAAPPPGSQAALHPIAALPFPPIAFPDTSAGPVTPGTVPAAPVALATTASPPAPAAPAAYLAPVPASIAPVPVVMPAPTAALPTGNSPGEMPSAMAPAVERRANPGQHWGRIELELRSSILHQITAQLPQEIDGIVQGRMQQAIDRLLLALAEEIHLAVTASLSDIVDRAVRAELDRMRNSNRG